MPTLAEIMELKGQQVRFQSIYNRIPVDQQGVLSEVITPNESDELQQMAFAEAIAMISLVREDEDPKVFFVHDQDLLNEVS